MHFVLFGCIWDYLVAVRNSVQTGQTSAKLHATKSRRNFSQRTCPIHPIGPLNLCFSVIRTIWVHFGPFVILTKIDAKRAELVQKFVPRNCVGIFRNERIQSTPLDPKLMFLCISNYLGEFGTVWFHSETRCKTGRTSANVRATKSR